MSYATPLEAKIAKKVTKAIIDYGLIEDGDRVMVGLSGGKDSWALMQILDVLRQRAPIAFSLIGVTVDSGYDGYRHDLISKTCEERGWDTASSTRKSARRSGSPRRQRDALFALCAVQARRALPPRDRSRSLQDRPRPPSRRLHRNAAPQSVLRRIAQGDAGASRLGQRRARRHPAPGRGDRSGGAKHAKASALRSSAAAVRPAAT